MEVIARINIDTPRGKKIVRDLEAEKNDVKLEYPAKASIPKQKTYSVDEAFEKCYDILSEHYKVDVRKL